MRCTASAGMGTSGHIANQSGRVTTAVNTVAMQSPVKTLERSHVPITAILQPFVSRRPARVDIAPERRYHSRMHGRPHIGNKVLLQQSDAMMAKTIPTVHPGSQGSSAVAGTMWPNPAAPHPTVPSPIGMEAGAVSAIVVTYRTGPVLRDCLEALLATDEVSEIVLVDNGNDTAVRDWLADLARQHEAIRVITPGRNIGFAAGCNLGVAASRGDFVALVNPDLIVPKDAFIKMRQAFHDRPDAWLCGGKLLDRRGREQQGSRRETLTPWRALVELTRLDRLFPNHPHFRRFHVHETDLGTGVHEVPTISGAFMVFLRQHYNRLGGMDDKMFLHVEDSEICLRIIKSGGKILYISDLHLLHIGGTSEVSSLLVEWHKARSGSYYFFKHFSESYPGWALVTISLVLWLRFLSLVPSLIARDMRTRKMPHLSSERTAPATTVTHVTSATRQLD